MPRWKRYLRVALLLNLLVLLDACGEPQSPTRSSMLAPSPASSRAAGTLTSQPTPSPLVRYRAWMEEARALHPYPEPLETMWSVMLCESSGDPTLVGERYHGLFQYHTATWNGEWNPYRDQPILDPRAQIFATAKAWQDGYQAWWGCYAQA